MNIMKNKLIFTVARIQNCWEHHQDGSDLLKSHQYHLFSLVFNDLQWAISDHNLPDIHYWTWWIDKYEEMNVRNVLKSKQEFKKYWEEINILEIIHAAIKTDGGNICIGKNHSEIFQKAEKGYFKKKGKTQGFLTSEHKFVDRKEAAKIAIKAGQISKDSIKDGEALVSEDLWVDNGFKYDPDKGYYKEEDTLKIKTR